MRIHVILRQWQPGANKAFRCMGQLDIVEQKLVDWAMRLPALPEILDVREDLRVIGNFGGHVGCDASSER